MEAPQVQVSGTRNSESNPTQDAPSNPSGEVEIRDTQDLHDPRGPQPEDATLPDVQEVEPATPAIKNPELSFLHFTSPIVEIVLGQGEHQTVLTAHQTLLLESPLLAERVKKFQDSGKRRIELPEESVEAFSCFLQFQYTRNYSVVKPTTSSRSQTPAGGADDSGKQLLRHAQIYTLAEKLGLLELKKLAHKKIHTVDSTPSGELAYARYVYTHTSADDTGIRRPVASYWASHGHALRHELGDEFRKLCIEVPEFTFDMLTFMLDCKGKKSSQSEADSNTRGSARKRLRSEK